MNLFFEALIFSGLFVGIIFPWAFLNAKKEEKKKMLTVWEFILALLAYFVMVFCFIYLIFHGFDFLNRLAKM